MKKEKKNGNFNRNQTSFYFEDYIETNKNKSSQKNNFLLIELFIILFIPFFNVNFCIKIMHVL